MRVLISLLVLCSCATVEIPKLTVTVDHETPNSPEGYRVCRLVKPNELECIPLERYWEALLSKKGDM